MRPPLMDIRAHLGALLRSALVKVAPEAADTEVVIERPRDAAHGDFACNLALQLAKRLKRNPRQLAGQLAAAVAADPYVAGLEVAGAGFINIRLTPRTGEEAVARVLAQGAAYGRARAAPAQKIMVEFVSANPTGPLHVGHGRQAALGDALAALLAAQG
ncbi:MAG: arginine--tRNA ligase, partial [Burkholderiales bacterium]